MIDEYPSDKIKSPIHTSVGQEYVSVGVCQALNPQDIVFGTYRGHALYLAKGGDLDAMIAELYGKKGGCANGKAGSMHLIDLSTGMMGTSAIVAASIPHAVGYAMALQQKKRNEIVVCFFGEGATDEGVFYESLNFASLKKLPILFVCENNNYAIYSKQEDRSAGDPLWTKVRKFGVSSTYIGDCDIKDLISTSEKIVGKIRKGDGPQFLEVATYRWYDHVGPDEDWTLGYRFKEEAEYWINNDPLTVLGKRISKEVRVAIDKKVLSRIDEACAYAEQSPDPDQGDLTTNVYA